MKRKKTVKNVIKNLPEIEITYDDWFMVNNEYVGSYENENFEVDGPGFSINFYIEAIQDCGIQVNSIILYIGQDEFEISVSDQKKIEKAIIKNILI